MNSVNLIGNLVRDPEIRVTTENQNKVANFTIALNNYNGSTNYISCVAWNKLAETIEKYCRKGNKVGVVGSLQTNRYEVAGQVRYATEVVVNTIDFLTKKEDSVDDFVNIDDTDDLPF